MDATFQSVVNQIKQYNIDNRIDVPLNTQFSAFRNNLHGEMVKIDNISKFCQELLKLMNNFPKTSSYNKATNDLLDHIENWYKTLSTVPSNCQMWQAIDRLTDLATRLHEASH
jgi:hypothetical protein